MFTNKFSKYVRDHPGIIDVFISKAFHNYFSNCMFTCIGINVESPCGIYDEVVCQYRVDPAVCVSGSDSQYLHTRTGELRNVSLGNKSNHKG